MDGTDFDVFVARSSRRLLRAAWLLTGQWAEAEDLVQNVLTLAWQRWETVSAAQSPDAYVQTMLTNSFLSSRRRVRWKREIVTAVTPDVRAPSVGDLELRHAVAQALDQLPSRQRAVLVLRYFCDLDVEDTARAMNCSTGTVKSQASRAIARLERVVALRDLMEDAS